MKEKSEQIQLLLFICTKHLHYLGFKHCMEMERWEILGQTAKQIFSYLESHTDWLLSVYDASIISKSHHSSVERRILLEEAHNTYKYEYELRDREIDNKRLLEAFTYYVRQHALMILI